MIKALVDYGASVLICALVGGALGILARDASGGALVGGVSGVFVGAAVRAGRTRHTRESYEERGLGD